MPIKTTVFALILAAAPTFGFSHCGADHTQVSANSCAQGQVWDDTAKTCVEQVSG